MKELAIVVSVLLLLSTIETQDSTVESGNNSTPQCITGEIESFIINETDNEIVVKFNTSVAVDKNQYNLSSTLNLNDRLTSQNTSQVHEWYATNFSACTSYTFTLKVDFCTNGTKTQTYQTTIKNAKTVSNIEIKSQAKSNMQVKWDEPIFEKNEKNCTNIKKNYSVKWNSTSQYPTETVEKTNFNFFADSYYQKYNVCVSVTYFSNDNNIIKSSEFKCNVSAESSPGKPSKPDITFKEKSTTSITISLKDPEHPNGKIDHFEIKCYSINIQEEWKIYNSSLIKIENLEPCTSYNILARAVNIDLDGKNISGDNEKYKTETAVEKPKEVDDLKLEPNSGSSYTLKWHDNSTCKANSYNITLMAISNCYDYSENSLTYAPEAKFDNLKIYTQYRATVIAFNSAGNSIAVRNVSTDVAEPEAITIDSNSHCSPTECNFFWDIPRHLTGPTLYTIELLNEMGKSFNSCKAPVIEESDCDHTSVLNCSVSNLEPCTKYIVHTKAEIENRLELFKENKTDMNIKTDIHEPEEVSNVTVSKYKIKWNKWKFACEIHYTVTAQAKSNCYNDTLTNLSINKPEVIFEDFTPFTEYQVTINATNSAGYYTTNASVITEIEKPLAINFTDSLCSENRCNFSWNVPEHLTGPTYYKITLAHAQNSNNVISKKSKIYKNEDCKMSKDSSLHFDSLDSCTTYSVDFQAIIEDQKNLNANTFTNVTTEIEKPLPVDNINVITKNDLSFKISWDKMKTACKVIYKVTWKPISNCNDNLPEAINKTNLSEIMISNLHAYTEYNISVVTTIEKYTSNPTNIISTSEYAIPNATIESHNCSATDCILFWSVPSHLTGPTLYNMSVVNETTTELNSCEEKFINKSDCSSKILNCSFDNLEPFTRYQFKLVAFVNDQLKSDDFATIRTKPSAPSNPKDFVVDCNFNDSSGAVKWNKPKEINGNLEYFILTYIGLREGKPEDKYNDTIGSSESEITVDLKPEFNYTFKIRAKTQDVEDPGNFSEFSCIKNTLKPESFDAKTNFTPSYTTSTTAVIILKRDDFPDENGKILNYSIILSQKAANHQRKRRAAITESENLSIETANETEIKFYRISPDNWNPFKDNDKAMCCNTTDKIAQCIIGCNDNCSESIGPCNGPLLPGTYYEMMFQICNAVGCVETFKISFGTQLILAVPRDDTNTAAIVVPIIVIFVFLIAGFLTYKRNDIRTYYEKRVKRNAPSEVDRPDTGNQLVTRPIKITDFENHYLEMTRDSSLKFSQEYEALKAASPSYPISAAQLNENRYKNRWINVLPFDHSRVKLLPLSDDVTTDYINASYIPGYNSNREYIATQGPLPNTILDFWRMIWEQNCQVIIMLTQCVERGKVKCEVYWPDDNDVHRYGDFSVQKRSESVSNPFTVRIFDLTMDSKKLTVTQIHFTDWPDFGCPEKPARLIEYIEAVHQNSPPDFAGPYVVHCSAGVGRTGTYIIVDRLMQHIHHHAFVDIYGLILEMRQHRINMVQTEDQYVYIHSCLRYILSGDIEEDEPLYANVLPKRLKSRESKF